MMDDSYGINPLIPGVKGHTYLNKIAPQRCMFL